MEQMKIQPEDWKEDYKEFDEATEKFYKGEVDAKTYKGISGGFGSYAQRGEMQVCCVFVCPAV